ncbi:TetR family transcriptional regulator [bacterium]|nr:TetR family transcriptional regulator [bacterium]
MRATSSVDRICQAAIRIAARDSLLAMTLDNVAKEAGISKGGVMYHFPTKEQLLTGVMQYFGERAERMLLRRIAEDPEPRYRWARAMLSFLFPGPDDVPDLTRDESEAGLSPEVLRQFKLAMLAAAANNPGLFEPVRAVGQRMRDRLLSDPQEGLDQLLVWLTVDGLFLWQFVGLMKTDDPLFQRVGKALREKISAKMEADTKISRKPRKAVSGKARSS